MEVGFLQEEGRHGSVAPDANRASEQPFGGRQQKERVPMGYMAVSDPGRKKALLRGSTRKKRF